MSNTKKEKFLINTLAEFMHDKLENLTMLSSFKFRERKVIYKNSS